MAYLTRASLRAKGALRRRKWDIVNAVEAVSGRNDPWSWQRFHREVRASGRELLAALVRFPASVLVTGCQRSGTTALARVLTDSDGMVGYRSRKDDELDAALILSGIVPHEPRGRYCFQTTYLNERYWEYTDPRFDFKLIWVLRNPFAVVYSMKYNWEAFAFDELFQSCGYPLLDDEQKRLYRSGAGAGLSTTLKACLSYLGKQMQALELLERLGHRRMLVVDYDDLVMDKGKLLARTYDHIDLPYRPAYAQVIYQTSVGKARSLSTDDRRTIEAQCVPVYEALRRSALRP